MKLLSLFDGSGGFPLAASLCGIEAVMASEIEPYPIAVTKSRFPKMKHLGNVTKIKGNEIMPVDIITFGSPCQDLSVAGKRKGLKHTGNGDDETTRSGLFMEAIRIIKEMREATNGLYPRYAIWENVPGAFSSNRGEDFRTVLEEFVKISEPNAVMPAVPKGGWSYADYYCGNGWSVAYRVFDAQYWGVPQRRRRVYIVADFRSECADKILFERQSLCGDFKKGCTPWKKVAANAERSIGTDDSKRADDSIGAENIIPINTMLCTRHKQLGRNTGLGIGSPGDKQFTISAGHTHAVCMPVLDDQGGQKINVRTDGKVPTLWAEMHGNIPCVIQSAGFKAGQSKAGSIGYQKECAATLSTQASGTEPTVVTEVLCMATQQGNAEIMQDKCPTITASAGMSGNNQPVVCQKEQYVFENHSQDARYKGPLKINPTLPAKLGTGGNNTSLVVGKALVYCLQGNGIDRADTAGCNGKGWKEDISYTLNTIDRPAIVYATSNGQANGGYLADVSGALNCMHDQQCVVVGTPEPIILERAYFNQGENAKYDPQFYTNGISPTLTSKGPHAVKVRYIVRRLTPTECARLQGFPDNLGHPEHKDVFSDEEYKFWLSVRNTHAEINGKQVKEYSKKKMLTWYNKLHSDSSEYKMWGNGIALPNALYVMQGIVAEQLKEMQNRRQRQ